MNSDITQRIPALIYKYIVGSISSDERDELNEKLEGAGKRLAELKRSLDAAKEDRTFDRVKLDYHQIRARLRIAKHNYIALLLAQKLLED